MNEVVLKTYVFSSIIIAATDIILGMKSIKKNKTTGRFLGLACIGAAIVDISYLISIISDSYMAMSVMSSIYFVSIDYMLVCLLIFIVYFTEGRFSKWGRAAIGVCFFYCLYELVIFAINPFKNIAIGYVRRDTVIAKYSYDMKPLYDMHLVFSYALVCVVLILLVKKLCKIPHEYRLQYSSVILGILALVGINAIFLYVPGAEVYKLLDYSICGYSLTSYILYWSCFNYSTHGMLNKLKTNIFENIGQGIVLFDYDNHLILHNDRADDFLGKELLCKCENLQQFLETYDLSVDLAADDDSFSLQCYIKGDDGDRPLRCDIRRLDNKEGRRLGQMFVFSDISLETDMLTGFQKWDSFQRLAMEEVDHFTFPVGVAICDINGLSVINSTRGNQAGDQRINALAGIMRKNFPERTYYVRGIDAHLIALCSHSSEEEMAACVEKVKEQYDGSIQYAVGEAADEGQSIVAAIIDAATAMKTKKLVDSESSHSDMLTSLIRALEECDSDTEQHVRRTQELGAELGRRIELSDIQQSKLALLCLLHDIGKVGVPMEILNKPGKLTDEEWKIMRSHVEKGYEIAMSNTELRQIAEEIRHHHERWDGNGYPDGLSRESIPVLSRVIAVVDAFDAMINDRPYRKGMPISKAIEELKSCAGSQFDPYIVSEFIRLVSEKYADSLAADSKQGAADGGVGADGNGENVGDRTAPGDGLADADGDGASTDDEQTEIRIMARRQMVDFTEYGKDAFRVHTVKYSRYLVDENWRIISVDDNFEELTGYSKEDIENNIITQIDLIPDEDKTEYLCQVNANLAKSTFVFQEHKIHRKDGRDIYVLCTGRMFYDSALQKDRGEIVIVDVSSTYALKMLTDAEQNKADVRLRNWENTYRTDPLTGLLNHAAFRSDMEQRLLECTHTAVMIMMDVDRFKQYNDTYGHHNGDKYLVLVAQTLQAALRGDDHACRMGGDEFAAMLFFNKSVSDDVIRERAQQIFDKVNLTVKATEGGTGISMGAVIARTELTFNEMYEEADNALYDVKESGRGRIEVKRHGE